MKGVEKFREKLPDYQGKRFLLFIAVVLVTLASSLVFQLFMDSLPRIFGDVAILQILAPFTPIIGSLIVLTIGFSIVYNFWRVREQYLMRYGKLAYQKAFKFVVIGVPMVITIIIHSFLPTDLIVPYDDINSISQYLAKPIFDIFFDVSILCFLFRILFFIFFLAIGLRVVNVALKVFGIDYMGLIYIFYPEESTLQNHEIYSIIRHPTYHTLMLLSISSIFFRFSIYSFIYFLIFIIGINIHIKFVEEKELIERFGEQYKKYKKEVPALIVRFKDLKKYLSLIF
ncbi:MAG: methyltransferase family protein [Candidatus Hodarchaeota archaeon]